VSLSVTMGVLMAARAMVISDMVGSSPKVRSIAAGG
jgi:hypothetical protein